MNNDKKWIPYFKRENSIYKKYPVLSWSITIIGIVIGIWFICQGYQESARNASYNAGYEDAFRKY